MRDRRRPVARRCPGRLSGARGLPREYRRRPHRAARPSSPAAARHPRPRRAFALPDAAAPPDAAARPARPRPAAPSARRRRFRARYAPVDLMLLVDSSLSMASPAGMNSTKWALTYEALLAFVRDPKSAGFGVGLQFFPTFPQVKTCTAETDCADRRRRAASRLALRETQRLRRAPTAAWSTRWPATPSGCWAARSGATCVPVGRCAMSQELCTASASPAPPACSATTAPTCPAAAGSST